MSKLFCINCGKDIPANAVYCPYCGAAQHGAEAGTFMAHAAPIMLQAAATAIRETAKTELINEEKYKDIPKRKLGSNAVWILFFSYFIKTIILPGLLLFAVVLEPLVFIIGLTAYVITLFVAAEIVYNNFTYQTDEVGLQKNFGVLHKTQITIPYQQIQNVNIRRSLMDRMLGLSHVSIETAGNSNGGKQQVGQVTTSSEGYLPGLTLDEAKYLHDLLLTRAQEANR